MCCGELCVSPSPGPRQWHTSVWWLLGNPPSRAPVVERPRSTEGPFGHVSWGCWAAAGRAAALSEVSGLPPVQTSSMETALPLLFIKHHFDLKHLAAYSFSGHLEISNGTNPMEETQSGQHNRPETVLIIDLLAGRGEIPLQYFLCLVTFIIVQIL